MHEQALALDSKAIETSAFLRYCDLARLIRRGRDPFFLHQGAFHGW